VESGTGTLQTNGHHKKPFNLLESYFNILEIMIEALQEDLKHTTQIDLVKPASKLYRLHSLKTKLKNCLTSDLACDIETSMPTSIINNDGHIFFVKIVSYTFPDKEAHKRIIYEYILKLEITESNNMGAFQRELSCNIKQYDAIQGKEWKHITTHIISQYHKFDSPPFQTGFNFRILAGLKLQTEYAWLCTLLQWMNSTCHDLISRNLWPIPEKRNNNKLNTVPMHKKQWDESDKPRGGSEVMTNTKQWASASANTTPRSISTATTA
jgi:hypothetical protein